MKKGKKSKTWNRPLATKDNSTPAFQQLVLQASHTCWVESTKSNYGRVVMMVPRTWGTLAFWARKMTVLLLSMVWMLFHELYVEVDEEPSCPFSNWKEFKWGKESRRLTTFTIERSENWDASIGWFCWANGTSEGSVCCISESEFDFNAISNHNGFDLLFHVFSDAGCRGVYQSWPVDRWVA